MPPAQPRARPRVLAWPAYRKRAANPHAALLADAIRAQGGDIEDWTPLRALSRPADLWHLHHPDTVVYPRRTLRALLGTGLFALLLAIARRRGTRVLWTVHDFDNNDGLHPRIERHLWRFFLPRIDAAICLTEGGVEQARRRFPALRCIPVRAIPHGHYRDVYADTVSEAGARERLGLPAQAPVLLHFGLMRPYKNVPLLVERFAAMDDPEAILVLAGQAYDASVAAEIRDAARGHERVRLHIERVAADEVQLYFRAADLVVLPYRRIVNSGALFLALSFERPVLVPDLGNMAEHARTFGSDWVGLYEGELTSEALADAVRRARRPARAPLDLDALGWDRVATRTIAFYDALTSPAARPSAPSGPSGRSST